MQRLKTPFCKISEKQEVCDQFLILLLGCLAFGVFWSAGLFVRQDASPDAIFIHYIGRLTKITACFTVALISLRHSIDEKKLFGYAAIALVISICCYAFRFVSPDFVLMSEVLYGSLSGIFGAFLTLLFARFFATFPARYSRFGVFLAFAICHLIFLASMLVPLHASIDLRFWALVFSPTLLIVCYRKLGLLKSSTEEFHSQESSSERHALLEWEFSNPEASKRVGASLFIREYYVVILGAAVLPFFYGIVAQLYSETGINEGLFDFSIELVVVIVYLAIAVIGFNAKGNESFNRTFVFALPVFATALVLAGDRFFFAGMIVKCATLLYLAAFWAFLARKAHDKPHSTFILFGVAQGLNHLTAMMGRGIGSTLHGSVESSVELLLAVVLLVIWMLALISWQFLSRRDKTLSQVSKTEEGNATYENKCALFALKYELSERESEVLSLFAHGRSAATIASMLAISTNTVKTHLRNIYIKAGIHSRQELLDLIEGADGPR